MADNLKVLIGKKTICKRFDIGSKTFYDLLDAGLPIIKINNRWIAHIEVIEDFIKHLTESRINSSQ